MAPPRFRRIVVALDASPHSVAALELAASLAARLEAELAGLYVEDAQVMGLADLPLVREIDFFSGKPRPIRARGVERQLARYAARARELLQRAVQGGEIRWSFHTVRGRPHDEVAGFAGEADLVILGVRGRSYGRGLGSTARTLAGREGLSLMIVGRGPFAAEGGVHVVHDGSEAADEAVVLGAALTPAGRGEVVVIAAVPRDREGGEPDRLADRLRERLARAGSSAELRMLRADPPDAEGIARALAAEGRRPECVVVPRPVVAGDEGVLAAIIRSGRCPVMVVG